MMRAATPSTYILAPRSGILPSETPPSGTPPLLPIPLPTPSLPLLLPSTDCRAGVSEVTLPPRKRLCIALGLRFEVGKSSSAPSARLTRGFREDYGFFGTLDDEIRTESTDDRFCHDDMYGYCKNPKKMVKTGQTRTREWIECTRAENFLAK
ncbi:hypothetical protein Tco_1390186, partial [Tanacetum coccineum]